MGADVEEDYLPGLEKIEVPSLVVWGDRDEHCPRSDQEAIARAIPHARLSVYPGTGHGLHWEEPERFAGDLAGFVESVQNETARASR